VAAAAVEYLAAEQTKVESFTITLDDQHGGLITRQIDVTIDSKVETFDVAFTDNNGFTVTKTIAVTITGTNDAPVKDKHDSQESRTSYGAAPVPTQRASEADKNKKDVERAGWAVSQVHQRRTDRDIDARRRENRSDRGKLEKGHGKHMHGLCPAH
jgi:hypothetical protein